MLIPNLLGIAEESMGARPYDSASVPIDIGLSGYSQVVENLG